MQFNTFIPRFDQHLTFPCDSRKLQIEILQIGYGNSKANCQRMS